MQRARIAFLLLFAPAALAAQEALRFHDVIRTAVSATPLVEAARARLQAAEASRLTARTIPDPLATLWIENLALPGRSSRGLDRETSTYVTLPLEFLYQRGPRTRIADEGIRAAEAELRSARWLVALEAARAFERVAVAQSVVDAAVDLRQGLEELRTYNETRVAEGATAEGELLRVQTEVDRAAIDEALARAELARAWAELRQFVPTAAAPAQPVTQRVVVEAGPLAVNGTPQLAELVERARAQQPELAAARARLDAARAAETYQRTLRVRQLGATLGTKRSGDETTLVAGISLPIPLFDRNRGEIARAAADRIAAEHDLEWTERRITSRVEAARRAMEILTAQLAALSPGLLSRAEESRQIALAAYREGAGTLVQVLDAARASSDLRQTYYQALLAREQGVLAIEEAVGADDPVTVVNSLYGGPR
ncbi:MAG TPA: TolC family protein [Thermoanaerobaculia bacterium]|nr:TolC family protein [Thermoanaerobaculia bacterium]